MNLKNIKKHLNAKLKDWVSSIDDEAVRRVIEENTIITGGALVSLLQGEPVHDYDVYFRTKDAVITVAKYYVDKWNGNHDRKVSLLWGEALESATGMDEGRVRVFARSSGIAEEDTEQSHTLDTDENGEPVEVSNTENCTEKEKYQPRFLTSNAITLSDKVQIVIRFYGDVEDIHKNYDFAHCTCSWSSWDNLVRLPVKALECIINKELYYVGSKYPLCSIVRTRKYIERGYHINAGQYVKMAMQLNELDLKDIKVLEDQLTGVDTAYFEMMVAAIQAKMEETGEQKIDCTYVIELINRLF